MKKEYVVLAGAGALGLGIALAYATHKTKAVSYTSPQRTVKQPRTTTHHTTTPPSTTVVVPPRTTTRYTTTPPQRTVTPPRTTTPKLIPSRIFLDPIPQQVTVGMVATLYYSGLPAACKYQGFTALNSPSQFTLTTGKVTDSAGHPVSNVRLSFYPESVSWSGDFYACYDLLCVAGITPPVKVGSGTQILTFSATPTDSNGNFTINVAVSNNVKINPPCTLFLNYYPVSGYKRNYNNITFYPISIQIKGEVFVSNQFALTISPYTETKIKSL